MSAPTLLLADLHLPPTRSPLRERFLAFLEGPALGAAAVYLLGDLFEVWIGDAEGLRDYAPEVAALRRLADAGVPVGFQHGNRDFLVGLEFAAACDLDLLEDPLRLELGGVPTLLSHGDAWCTDDRGYQRWRRFSRNRLAQRGFAALPEALRRRIAGAARGHSEHGKHAKPAAITDVHPAAIEQAFTRHGVTQIIHGHTHRPADHRLIIRGRPCERRVLADWRPERCEVLAVDEDGPRRVRLPD